MDRLERILSMLDQTSYRRRDSSQCILIIWGLAVTVMTIRHDEKENKHEQKLID